MTHSLPQAWVWGKFGAATNSTMWKALCTANSWVFLVITVLVSSDLRTGQCTLLNETANLYQIISVVMRWTWSMANVQYITVSIYYEDCSRSDGYVSHLPWSLPNPLFPHPPSHKKVTPSTMVRTWVPQTSNGNFTTTMQNEITPCNDSNSDAGVNYIQCTYRKMADGGNGWTVMIACGTLDKH